MHPQEGVGRPVCRLRIPSPAASYSWSSHPVLCLLLSSSTGTLHLSFLTLPLFLSRTRCLTPNSHASASAPFGYLEPKTRCNFWFALSVGPRLFYTQSHESFSSTFSADLTPSVLDNLWLA